MSEFNKEVFLQNLKEVNTVLKQIHICIDNIVKLSNDMAGADSEINEAILQLQQNVITINGTLNGHTQDITNINTALANKMYKVIEVDDTATSGTFTDEEYSQILNDNSIVIKRGSGYFIREFEYTLDNDFIRFRHLNTLNVSLNVITASSQYITVPKSTNAWTYTSNSDIKFYNQNYIDTYIQYKLTSGTNIKTINGESILGSGDLPITSGMQYETLWTNPNYSNVVSQIDNIEFMQYKYLIICFKLNTTATYYFQKVVAIDESFISTNYAGYRIGYEIFETTDNTAIYQVELRLWQNEKQIAFANRYKRTFADISTQTTDNNCFVPVKIFGIK